MHELKDVGGEMITTGQKHMLLDDPDDVDGGRCAIVMPSVAAPNGEIGERQKLIEQGDKHYPPYQEECNSSSSSKEGTEEGLDGYERHAGGNAVEVEVATEEKIEVIIDYDEMKIDGHMTTTEHDEINNQNVNYVGGDSDQDDKVVLLGVREGKTGGFSTTAANLTPPKESANTCSIVSSPIDCQGYCTTPSQEVVKQQSILRTNQSPRGAANVRGHDMRVTSQRSQNSSSEEVVVIEKSNHPVGPLPSVIQKQQLDEKGMTNNTVAVGGGGDDLADPPISKHSGVTLPRNPYMEKKQIVSLSESCKVVRAQSSSATMKIRAVKDEGTSFGINVRNANDADTLPAGKKGRFLLRPERGEDHCIENDSPPETAAYSMSDTQQVEACKRRLAYLESPSPMKSTQLSLLRGGDDPNVDAQFSLTPNDDLERSGLGLVSLSSETVADTTSQGGEESRYHSKKYLSNFCVAFCDLNEEQERVSVGLLRILRQGRVVLDDNISLVLYLNTTTCYSLLCFHPRSSS